MIYFGRIDISEGDDVNKQLHQNSVMFVTIGIFKL